MLNFTPPDTLEGWAKAISDTIEVAQQLPPLSGPQRPVRGAPWREGKFMLVGAWVTALVLVALNVVLWLVKE